MASILVVDDEESMRRVLKYVFSKAGYDVRLAGNGTEALSSYGERPADLILMDLTMPYKDGFETIIELRQKMQSDVKIVVMSGDFARKLNSSEIAQMVGVDAAFGKPFELSELLQTVRELLEKD
jgi:CheY-like chemotaxis protein